jgi:hypothetical protein
VLVRVSSGGEGGEGGSLASKAPTGGDFTSFVELGAPLCRTACAIALSQISVALYSSYYEHTRWAADMEIEATGMA